MVIRFTIYLLFIFITAYKHVHFTINERYFIFLTLPQDKADHHQKYKIIMEFYFSPCALKINCCYKTILNMVKVLLIHIKCISSL
jgi:hypothetical protein